MIQARLVMFVLTATLWMVACGPAAPASQGGESAAEPTVQAADIAPGVQMLNASIGDRGSAQSGSVRSQAPTPALTPMVEPAETPAVVRDDPPTPIAATEPALTPTVMPTPTLEATVEPESVHGELYDAINTIRASVSEWPLEVDLGLEAAAQEYAETGAGNTGSPRVPDLLFDHGVRCKEMQLRRAPTSHRPAENWEGQHIALGESHMPGFAGWADANEEYATHLLWWMEWPTWDTIFLGSNWTHFGYGAAEAPRIGHEGVIFLCEK